MQIKGLRERGGCLLLLDPNELGCVVAPLFGASEDKVEIFLSHIRSAAQDPQKVWGRVVLQVADNQGRRRYRVNQGVRGKRGENKLMGAENSHIFVAKIVKYWKLL